MVFNWIDAHVRAYEYFGGVPKGTVSDNTKTAVIIIGVAAVKIALYELANTQWAVGQEPSFETAKGVTPNEENGLLEQVLERENMLQALHRVERNQGAPGNGVPL